MKNIAITHRQERPAPMKPVPPQFSLCATCAYALDKSTSRIINVICAHPETRAMVPTYAVTIGAARAAGMPCGPMARLVSGAGNTRSALDLERSESETSNGDAWRDMAAKLGFPHAHNWGRK